MKTDVPYREVSLPASVRRGVKLASETKTGCAHKWVKAHGVDCQTCELCGAYSALSILKMPLCRDEKLAEELLDARHQWALGYNFAVNMALEYLPFAVGQALWECEAWQQRKKIDEFYPVLKNIKRWMINKNDVWSKLDAARNEDSRFASGQSRVHRSGANAGFNAVLAAYDRYARAHNSVFYVKQHNRQTAEHNKRLLAEYEQAKAASPDEEIPEPKLRKMKQTKKSDLEAIEKGIYGTTRLFSKKKDRHAKPIALPLQEPALYRHKDNTIKLNGLSTRLRPKRCLPEGLDIRNGTIVETTSFLNADTKASQRMFALHLCVRHLIPAPAGAGGGQIGIDMGIAVSLATSDGEMIHIPEELHAMRREIVKLQKLKAKRRQGSRGWSQAKNEIAATSRLLAARKKQFMAETALKHCQTNSLIGLEDFNNQNMRKSAGGTRRKPGRGVSAKKSLNREMAFLAPGMIVAAYKRAAIKTGTRVVLVEPEDSSNECSACGHVSKENRESQEVFRCKAPRCDHSENADTNAARNILARAVAALAAARLAADARTMSAGGSGQSPKRTGQPDLKTAPNGQRQLSEAGKGNAEQHRPTETSPL